VKIRVVALRTEYIVRERLSVFISKRYEPVCPLCID
jgi:hypothetical protein